MMRERQRTGRRYLAGLVIVFAVVFFLVGTFGPAHRSPFYFAIVPLPAAAAAILGCMAWTSDNDRSTAYSAAALVLLIAVLGLSHLLPRSA